MKKVSFFPIITLFILLINSFIVCAEEVYPPGEIYAVEKIITDSYPVHGLSILQVLWQWDG